MPCTRFTKWLRGFLQNEIRSSSAITEPGGRSTADKYSASGSAPSGLRPRSSCAPKRAAGRCPNAPAVPSWPGKKFAAFSAWRGCSTRIACSTPLASVAGCGGAATRPHNSTSSASGVANGIAALAPSVRPVQVMIKRSPAASTASSRAWRSSARGSLSPISTGRWRRSSPSGSLVASAASSKPAMQITR